ncbi:MAG: hypothetical protein EZS28_029423 [Streblomastix strix]|uniref:proton-translocating NAD(P)(+) transhydrogenase n=1 Tax=Streblomastix strix TaxID=222440 RepID=A0A5J4UXY0_9EUKA|nr:MAG: hypothetical protein EZS28_029423 [Streblomastix strix]
MSQRFIVKMRFNWRKEPCWEHLLLWATAGLEFCLAWKSTFLNKVGLEVIARESLRFLWKITPFLMALSASVYYFVRNKEQPGSSFIVSTQSGLDYQRKQVQYGTQSELYVLWVDVQYCQHDITNNQKEESQADLGIKQMDEDYQQQETRQVTRSCKVDRLSQLSSSPISSGFSPFEITQLIVIEKITQEWLRQGNNFSEVRFKGNQMVKETTRDQFTSFFDYTQSRSVTDNICLSLGMGRCSSANKRGRNNDPWSLGKELVAYFIQLERDNINPLLSKKIRVNTSQQVNSSPKNPNIQHDYNIQYKNAGCSWSIRKTNIDNIRKFGSKYDSIINNKLPQQNQRRISSADHHHYTSLDLPVLVQSAQPNIGQTVGNWFMQRYSNTGKNLKEMRLDDQEVLQQLQLLRKHGFNYKVTTHPVAGKLPKYKNVLLAEARVPFDIVFEMDIIIKDFQTIDVFIILSINDTIITSTLDNLSFPIAGILVIE